ncbi:hypothetical protein BMW22_15395 [Rhizobium leguminosarum]|uniref:Uncharacterized protein n=1 Tax=Rhizobium leguminosarum TaxID=384 RepID=A0A1L3ZAZ1_RHILE|nr:hypothetical protein [Rhizobium leguminosarum]API52813.1 hypothetical protein BMW22_15395 [Rhizobium leguminosarum]
MNKTPNDLVQVSIFPRSEDWERLELAIRSIAKRNPLSAWTDRESSSALLTGASQADIDVNAAGIRASSARKFDVSSGDRSMSFIRKSYSRSEAQAEGLAQKGPAFHMSGSAKPRPLVFDTESGSKGNNALRTVMDAHPA